MNFGFLIRNGGEFFFKNILLFICLLKKCLYLCQILITKTLKNEIKHTN